MSSGDATRQSRQRTIAEDIAAVNRIDSVPTILQAAANATGMRFTAVARVTDSKWTACAVYDRIDFGLKAGGELVLESTICNEIRQHHQMVVFNQASANPHFKDHHTVVMYGIESYISIPIFVDDGRFFGTLCAIDPLPAKLDDPHVVETMQLFARLVGSELDGQDRLDQSASALVLAQETAKLREQFIAVLGHDLRNPLMAMQAGVDMLQSRLQDARSQTVLDGMRRSGERIASLINDILDFARGRLGDGIPVSLQQQDNLPDELRNVIDEVRRANPSRVLEVTMTIGHPVACDTRRLAQLLVNLLVNAIVHGDPEQPIRVTAQTDEQAFELAVSNGGEPIAQDKIARLFQPFTRGDEQSPSGLGLGLYIASEVARAHGGTLGVVSTQDETRFVFRMPLHAAAIAPDASNRENDSLAC